MVRILIGTAGGIVEVGGEHHLAGTDVTALATDGSRVIALAGDRDIYAPDDGTWTRIAQLPDGAEGTSLLVSGDEVLAGAEEAHLYRMLVGEVTRVEAFDDAPGRAKWYTPWGGPPAVRSMTRTSDGETFLNVHVGGILRSRDLTSFHQTIDIDTDVHEVTHDEARLYAALGVEGVAVSDDRGDSWHITTDGLHGAYVRTVQVAGDAVVVAASTGPSTRHAALYRRSRASSGSFERCVDGLPERFGGNIDTGWLGSDDDTLAVVSPEGDVYTSSDEGASWTQIAEAVGSPRWLVVL